MKEIATYLVLFFIMFGMVPISVSSTPDSVTIRLDASTSHVTIGDSLSVFCTVTTPDDVQTSEPYLIYKSPLFDIEKQWEKSERADTGSVNEHYGFLLYVFAPDTLRVGPFIVQYVTAEGDTGIVQSDTIMFPVTGVVQDPESPPLPNRSPFEIASQGIPFWMIIVLALFILIAVVVGAYLMYRKKRSLRPVPMKPIDEIGEFERIRKLKLQESGRFKELYFLVSTALRGFIHRKMEFDALYETTHEITQNLTKTSQDTGITGSISEILEESDRVKFAKYTPAPEFSSSLIDRALEPVNTILADIERKKEAEVSTVQENKKNMAQASTETSTDKSGRD